MINVLVESCFESPCYAVYVLKSIPLVCLSDIYKCWSFIFIYPLPPPPPRPKVTGNIASKYRGLTVLIRNCKVDLKILDTMGRCKMLLTLMTDKLVVNNNVVINYDLRWINNYIIVCFYNLLTVCSYQVKTCSEKANSCPRFGILRSKLVEMKRTRDVARWVRVISNFKTKARGNKPTKRK